MKSYTITVNGNVYDVTVEENGAVSAPAAAPRRAAAPAPAAVAAPVVEEASNDDELAAVISAAIAAYEAEAGGSTDGFVVRSIKRRPSNKWHA